MRPMVEMLLTVWGEPNSTDADKYLAQVAKAVEGYSDEIQRKAAEHLSQNYRSSRYPLPADCRKACMTIAEEMSDGSKRVAINPYPEWSRKRIASADAMMRSELGKRAADEGWALGLHDFLRNNQRHPTEYEAANIIRASRLFDEAYEAASNNNTPLGRMLKQLGDEMLRKRELSVNIAYGEIRP